MVRINLTKEVKVCTVKITKRFWKKLKKTPINGEISIIMDWKT
jgi:hypothetical protein